MRAAAFEFRSVFFVSVISRHSDLESLNLNAVGCLCLMGMGMRRQLASSLAIAAGWGGQQQMDGGGVIFVFHIPHPFHARRGTPLPNK